MTNDFNWTKYREGLEQKIMESGFTSNVDDANFMADLVVLMAKNQHLGKHSNIMNWKHMEILIQKVISNEGYMAVCGY